MTAAITAPAAATPRPTRRGPAVDVPVDVLAALVELDHEPSKLLELGAISAQWQIALDAAEAALRAAVGVLSPCELGLRGTRLVQERRETADALDRFARVAAPARIAAAPGSTWQR